MDPKNIDPGFRAPALPKWLQGKKAWAIYDQKKLDDSIVKLGIEKVEDIVRIQLVKAGFDLSKSIAVGENKKTGKKTYEQDPEIVQIGIDAEKNAIAKKEAIERGISKQLNKSKENGR